MIKFECLNQNALFKLQALNRYTLYIIIFATIGWLFESTHTAYMDKNTKSVPNNSCFYLIAANLWKLSEATAFWCVNLGVYKLLEGREYEKEWRKKNQQWQKWQKWPIRLYRMVYSLELFKQYSPFRNAVEYGNLPIQRKHNLMYRINNLIRISTQNLSSRCTMIFTNHNQSPSNLRQYYYI